MVIQHLSSMIMKRRHITLLLLCGFFCAGSSSIGASSDPSPSPPTSAMEEDSFSKVLSKKMKSRTESLGSIVGVDGWAFFPKELSHLATNSSIARANKAGDPIPAIVDFNNQLKSAGIELLLVPVPPKAIIYPDKFTAECPIPPPAPTVYDSVDRSLYRELTAQGVHVLDLGDAFLKARREDPTNPIYCRVDTHWSPAGIEIASREIIKEVGAPAWMQGYKMGGFTSSIITNSFVGDLASTPSDQNASETFVLNSIAKPGDAPEQLPSISRQSPIVLLGDSHNLIFHSGGDMHAVGAGLPDRLAAGFGMPLDLVAVRGSGATAARWNLVRRHDNLAGKKLVIWCFTARDFTEGGRWDKVPVIKGQLSLTNQPVP